MLLNELADLEARALTPTRTRKQAVAEANRRRASRGLPLLSSSTVSDWFKRGSPARDFATLWTLVEVLVEWADPRTRADQRDQATVKQLHQRRWKLLWEAARDEPPAPSPAPEVGRVSVEPQPLSQVILSTYIDPSIDISGILGRSLAAVPRSENRAGWQLLCSKPRRWAETGWPIRHHSHRVGELIWHNDGTGWELSVPNGRWEDEGQEPDIDTAYSLRYLMAPPAKRGEGTHKWADPADALLALADYHYCPRTTLATLFRLVDEGVSVDEASRVVHINPLVGELLVRRAQRIHSKSGRPLLAQVDDFLPIPESDWKVGMV